MKPVHSAAAAAIIYYKLPDGHLYHWVIDAHGAKDTVDTLRTQLGKWIPGAEFVEGRIEKLNMVNRDEINYHERLRYADYLARDATIIETSDGHRLSRDGEVWYAHPLTDEPRRNVDKRWWTTGNAVLRGDDSEPKAFATAIEAYQACLEAAGYFDKIADAEARHREVQCSTAL